MVDTDLEVMCVRIVNNESPNGRIRFSQGQSCGGSSQSASNDNHYQITANELNFRFDAIRRRGPSYTNEATSPGAIGDCYLPSIAREIIYARREFA